MFASIVILINYINISTSNNKRSLVSYKSYSFFYYISINVIKLLKFKGYNCLVIAKDNFFK